MDDLLKPYMEVINKISARRDTKINNTYSKDQKTHFEDSTRELFEHEILAIKLYIEHYDKKTQSIPVKIVAHQMVETVNDIILRKLSLPDSTSIYELKVIKKCINDAIKKVRLANKDLYLSDKLFTDNVIKNLLSNLPTRVYTDEELTLIANLIKYSQVKRLFRLSVYHLGKKVSENVELTPKELSDFLKLKPIISTNERYFLKHFLYGSCKNTSYQKLRNLMLFEFHLEYLSLEDEEFLRKLLSDVEFFDIENTLQKLKFLQSKKRL